MDEVSALLTSHTDRLLGTVGSLPDVGGPSLCEGWTRGHVITHVARNAEAITRLADWALDGTPREMYPGGTRGRDADIEAGAARPVDDQADDLRTTAALVADALDRLAAGPVVADRVEMRGGLMVPPSVLPRLRLREVVFHHVDLDAGFGFADVEPDLLDEFLADAVERLTAAAPDLHLALVCDEGPTWTSGERGHHTDVSGAEPVEVRGSRAGLLLWLARRIPDGVRSGGHLPELPRGS
jgi:maleylpyruvate isomerase